MKAFDVIEVERNGRLWRLHWKNRYDPGILAITGLVGTGISVAGTLQQGRQQEAIAKQRAAVDIQNAAAVREATEEEARIKGERGRRLLATQKSQAAAGGIRLNVGAPLVIAKETQREIAKDIGLGLERGRAEEGAFLSSAAIERASGKAAKRRSRFSALSQGLLGLGIFGTQARDAGLFKNTSAISPAGTFRRETGIGQVRFGRRFLRS